MSVEITPVRFQVGAGRNAIFIEDRGNGKWAVSNGCSVLATDGEWEYEPRPSNRDDDFLARTRFTLDEAKRRAVEAYEKP